MPELYRLDIGLELDVEIAGPPDARPLLFLHDAGLSLDQFEAQALFFSADWHVILPSLRGHGRSSAADDYRVAELALDVIELLDQLTLSGVTIIGHGLGGIVGYELLARNAALFNALITINAPPVWDDDSDLGVYLQLLAESAPDVSDGLWDALLDYDYRFLLDDPPVLIGAIAPQFSDLERAGWPRVRTLAIPNPEISAVPQFNLRLQEFIAELTGYASGDPAAVDYFGLLHPQIRQLRETFSLADHEEVVEILLDTIEVLEHLDADELAVLASEGDVELLEQVVAEIDDWRDVDAVLARLVQAQQADPTEDDAAADADLPARGMLTQMKRLTRLVRRRQ